MAIDLQICNEALSEIGARSEITDVNEVSTEGKAARLFYDSVRKRLLRAVHWGFARRTALLTLDGTLDAGTSTYPFLYSYLMPANSLAVRYILPTNAGDLTNPGPPQRDCRFLFSNTTVVDVEVQRLVSNTPDAVAVYTGDITTVDFFDDLFRGAFVAILASKFAMPCTGNVSLKSQYEQIAAQHIMTAQAVDANEAVPSTEHTPDWLLARGIASMYPPEWGMYYASPIQMNWGA
jgi:hypothetical protein